jgi:hypothetical protein
MTAEFLAITAIILAILDGALAFVVLTFIMINLIIDRLRRHVYEQEQTYES